MAEGGTQEPNQGGGSRDGKGGTLKKQPKKVWSTTKFTGRCEELNGHIYDCSYPRTSPDMYAVTTREIAEYMGRKYRQGGDIRMALERLEMPTMRAPDDPPANATRSEERAWEVEVAEHVKRQGMLRENLRVAYAVIFGQCSEAMRQKIKAHRNFNAAEQTSDAIVLLRIIRDCMYQVQTNRNKYHMIHEAKRNFYLFSQGKRSCDVYFRQFKGLLRVADQVGASLGMEQQAIQEILAEDANDPANPTDAETVAAVQKSQDMYFAVALIMGADRDRYGKLIEDLENARLQGDDKFPTTLVDAYTLLVHWKRNPRNITRMLNQG